MVIVDQREDLAGALIAELGETVTFVGADVTSEEGWARAMDASDGLGGLDIPRQQCRRARWGRGSSSTATSIIIGA